MSGVPVLTSSAARSPDGVNSIRLESMMDWAAAADAMASSKIDAISPCRAFERYPDMSSPGGPEVQAGRCARSGPIPICAESTKNPQLVVLRNPSGGDWRGDATSNLFLNSPDCRPPRTVFGRLRDVE